MFSKYIQIFLDHFKYLNDEGKRAGFLLFSNSQLTADLEHIAQTLNNNLGLLKQEPSFSTQVDQFITHINNAFHHAEDARVDRASLKSKYYRVQLTFSPKAIVIDYDYKIPYKPAKFEQELVNGLSAALSTLQKDGISDPDYNKAYHACTGLLNAIRDYSPEEKVVEDRSCIP